MRQVWSPAATRDLQAIRQYIADDNPTAAIRIVRAIVERIDTLTSFPNLGRPGRVDGTRELAIAGTPFIVAYRSTADVIFVIRVLHGARTWPDAL